jgi:hypothetical protein
MRRAIQRPDEQVAFTRDLLSGLTRAMRAPVTEAVRKLAHEIATADELLIDLVRNAYLEQNPVDRAGARDGVLEHVPPPGLLVSTAAIIALVWGTSTCSTSRLARRPTPPSPHWPRPAAREHGCLAP